MVMEPVITTRNVKLTPKLRSYCEKKTERLGRYMPNLAEVKVDLAEVNAKAQSDRQVVELTVRDATGTILRAEEREADIYAAVDLVMDKMYRQIKRYRGKMRRNRRSAPTVEELALIEGLEPLPIDDGMEEEDAGTIVRTKRFEMFPMSAEEAIDQMELLGHDFFMFFNVEVDAANVVYRRRNGTYGLLQPEMA